MIRLVLLLSIFVFIDFTSCKSTVKVNNTDPSYDYNDYDDYESDNDDDTIDYESVYDLIRDELPEVLTQVERKYKTHIQHHHGEHVHGEHPLLSLVSQEPHTMTIMIKPNKMEPEIKIRLLYERVPVHRIPNITHLDRPVIESVPIIRNRQTYVIANLPRGKYIVCGEAMDHSEYVFQESCFETKIHREVSEDLQDGVKAIIGIAITIVILVLIYNVVYQIQRSRRSRTKKKEVKIRH